MKAFFLPPSPLNEEPLDAIGVVDLIKAEISM